MDNIHPCAIGALEERALVVPSYTTLHCTWQTAVTTRFNTHADFLISCRNNRRVSKTYQDLQQHCATHRSHLLFNMLIIAILLFALLGINQVHAGVRNSNTRFSNNSI